MKLSLSVASALALSSSAYAAQTPRPAAKSTGLKNVADVAAAFQNINLGPTAGVAPVIDPNRQHWFTVPKTTPAPASLTGPAKGDAPDRQHWFGTPPAAGDAPDRQHWFSVAPVVDAAGDPDRQHWFTAPAAGDPGRQHWLTAPKSSGPYLPNSYLVEFDPTHPINPMTTVKNFLTSHDPKTYNAKTLHARTTISTPLFKGQSFTIDAQHNAADLLKIPGAKKIYPVRIIKRPTVQRTAAKSLAVSADQDITSHAQTGVAEQHAAGNFGKGVKVAVVDTGVYYKHPALGGCFGKGCKISFGKDLVGDNYSTELGTSPVEDPDPLDNCSDEAHGTHTTGIIGADARNINTPGFVPARPFTGVAPSATLGHYRVFGCSGSTSSDVMAKAIYSAFEDGADIISMSIGSAGVVPVGEIDSVAVERVAKAGVHVVVSAGNDGGEGLFTTGSPSVAPSAYSVAAYDIHAILQPQIFDTAGKAYPYAPAAAHGGWKGDQQFQIVVADPNDHCVAKKYPEAAGKVLMVQYSPSAGCGTSKMCLGASQNNATGCLIYGLPGAAAGNAAISGAVLDAQTAPLVLAAVAKNPTAMWHFTDKSALFKSATASTASSFSSYGTDIELNMKPDIASIGGNVYSTVSPHAAQVAASDVSYAYMSGTSMACPNFAGAVALFIEARGRLSVDRVKAAFLNNGQITKVFSSALTESPVRGGGGLVNATSAILSNAIFTPSQLSLNDTKHAKASYKLNLKNAGKQSVTYTLSDIASGTITGLAKGNDIPIPMPVYANAPAKVTLSQKKVTVAAGKSVDITVKIAAPKADASLFPFYGGYIVATPSDGSLPVHVPYLGMVGDFSKAKVIAENDPTPGAVVTSVFDATGAPIAEGATVNATQGIGARLVLGQSTRIAFVDVIAAGNSLPGYTPSLGVISSPGGGSAYMSNAARNIDVSGQGFTQGGYIFPWAGATTLSPVDNSILNLLPAGSYKIRFTALKHFGDAANPKDFEVVTSPAFNIVY
ncbi:hypothetical protein HDU87_007294 [Geranomyces variabilis]|uniref:Uncharacterized protein n=1 Tax=Geranomyces variabilis TaxID=109894 RepID=A0AAD5TGQ9_9FUNG|nr:hypothetical protein HDU87_007294 [Geranomyces variabilis]